MVQPFSQAAEIPYAVAVGVSGRVSAGADHTASGGATSVSGRSDCFLSSGEIPNVVCFILAILGIFAWGHEYRHGMIRASLTALNSRTALFVAKTVVVGLWVAGEAAYTRP